MPISVTCSHCGKRLKARDELAGKALPCPSCKEKVLIPETEEDIAGYLLQDEPPSQEPSSFSQPSSTEEPVDDELAVRRKPERTTKSTSKVASLPEGMTVARLTKAVAFLRSPLGQRVRTNNHVERLNRQVRSDEKARYRWRTGRGIVHWVALLMERCRQSRMATEPSRLFAPGTGADSNPRSAVETTAERRKPNGRGSRAGRWLADHDGNLSASMRSVKKIHLSEFFAAAIALPMYSIIGRIAPTSIPATVCSL